LDFSPLGTWTIHFFPLKGLKGERIPAQGKRVFERRLGSPVKNMDLPCKGNGTVNTVSLSFHWTPEEHCVTEDGHAVARAVKTRSRCSDLILAKN
jgi:hypothetical protein